jgi:hypothetical protein
MKGLRDSLPRRISPCCTGKVWHPSDFRSDLCGPQRRFKAQAEVMWVTDQWQAAIKTLAVYINSWLWLMSAGLFD